MARASRSPYLWVSRFLLLVLMAFGSVAGRAQPIQPEVLWDFPYGNSPRGPEYPYGHLVQGSDGNFYGTTTGGGSSNRGTVFKATTNGIITTLVSFNGTNGAAPWAGLALGSDGNFYGTTYRGGTSELGTVFKVTPEGTLTTLVFFDGTNGAGPTASLTLGDDGNFYGTTESSGTVWGYGTVFKMTPEGTLTTLVTFDYANGANPNGPLTKDSDGSFYGTTSDGGASGQGTVFKLTADGTFTNLVSFSDTDGAGPQGPLTKGPDGSFYGTTAGGGALGAGTVFKVTTNGVVTTLMSFNVSNGGNPIGALALGGDGNLYGTTYSGGNSSYGTIFKVTPTGALRWVVSFNNANGLEPHGGVTLGMDGHLYGTTAAGGGGGTTGSGAGVLFRITTNGALTRLASFGKIVGASPRAPLTLGKDGDFYGTTVLGGSNGMGIVYKMTTNGNLTSLASFNTANGAYPHTALTLGNDGSFYGITVDGGSSGAGTVFRVATNGTLTRLVSFTGGNGAYPQAALTLGNDGNFYGTTEYGGLINGSPTGWGTVFRVTTNGILTRLASFNNTNGANPRSALTLGSDGNLYGTTPSGGSGGMGTVFRVATNGALTALVSFEATNGQRPQGALTLGPDGNFYGLTGSGVPYGPGSFNRTGTVFRVTATGGLTTLSSFIYSDPGNFGLTDLTLGGDGNFYGTVSGNGSVIPGAVFQVTTNGAFATLFSFGNTNGAVPLAPLTLGPDGSLYGTTTGGGSTWDGTIFRLTPRAPVIFSQPSPANQVVQAGVDVTINAGVFGASPQDFQWVFNDRNQPGSTSASLILKYVTPSMSGEYRLRVTNSLGTTWSSNAVLTVLPALLTNLPVTGVTGVGAVLNGSVTLGPNETLAWFEWGVDTNYGEIDGVTSLPGGSGTVRVSAPLSGLNENQVYHYRLVAWNSFGIVYGPDQTFRVGSIYGYAQSVLADEPLVYYRFDETNGTVALNSGFIGEAFNATYNPNVSLGKASLVPKLGRAAEFNNKNSSVAVPALGSYSQITIEAWLKPRSFPRNEEYFDSIYTTDNWVEGALHTHLVNRTYGSRFEYEFSIMGNEWQWVNAGDSSVFATNSWFYVAATYDSAARQVITYVNGRALATNTFSTAVPVNLTEAHIGSFTTNNWFDGWIDELAIYGSALPAGRIQAHFEAAGNPLLLSQPSSRTNNFGTTASFTVLAGGSSPLQYQWLKNGSALADRERVRGAQTATLTISNVFKGDEGAYSVSVRNSAGKVTSAEARLAVIEPLITSPPESQAAELNGSVTLSVVAVGTPPLGYQWLKEGAPLARATNASLLLTNLQAGDAGRYVVVVSNSLSSVTSVVASLSVNLVTGDPAFNPGTDGTVYAMAMQPDGKLLVGGGFTTVGGQPRTNLARLNPDGNVDVAFDPRADGWVTSMAVQTDGKILVGGEFSVVGGHVRTNLARLNPDGSVDTTFNAGANSMVQSLALQADGRILVGGYFTSLGGERRDSIGRLNPDGSLDAAFNPGAAGLPYYNAPVVHSLVVQGDGKILVGGAFGALGGQSRTNLARLNADGSPDAAFNPGVGALPYYYTPVVYSLAVQADGKILVGGSFNTLGGQPRLSVGRLHSDGSLDTSFDPGTRGNFYGYYLSVFSLAVQADGKILVGGWFPTLAGQPRNNLCRLNADGSADLAFAPGTDWNVFSLALQADGKILVGGAFSTLGGQLCNHVGRLNNNESATQNLTYADSTILWQRGGASPELWRAVFELTTNSLDWTSLGAGTRVPGGWQLTGVSLPPSCTVRARGFANGGYQNASGWFVESYWGALLAAHQPSSRTNNAGTIATFNMVAGGTEPLRYQWFKDGVALADAARVSGAQTATLVLSSVLKADEGAYTVEISHDSDKLTSGVARLTVVDPVITSQPTSQAAELHGSATLNVGAVGTLLSYRWLKEGMPLLQATNSSLVFTNLELFDAGGYAVVVSNQFNSVTSAVAMLTVNGAATDPTLNPGVDYFIYAMAVQPDGKTLVGGDFYTLGGQPRSRLGRLNADGSVDMAFNPGVDGGISSIAVQGDGKILVGGWFTTMSGQWRTNLARLNADGSVDTAFNSGSDGGILSIIVQADGKILVGGGFTTVAGQPRTNIARLNADGSLDTAFNSASELYSTINSLALQADGKVLVGGYFTTLGGQWRTNLARLNADGSVDPTFNPGTDNSVVSLVVQADGKILVAGYFTTLAGQPRNSIGRLNADGSLDSAFNPAPQMYSSINSLALQADGRILVGGWFTTMSEQWRANLARLNADGSVDPTFNPGADSGMYSLALQADGKILAAGYFTTLAGQARYHIGRLSNTGPATQALAYDGSTLLWQRGGASPEVWRTTFEMTTNSLDWLSLGAGARVPGGWQLTGVSLPADCTVRARGLTSSGFRNSSSWFVESYWGALVAVSQPASRTNNAGTTATFHVVAGGTGPLRYQWFKDGVALTDGGLVTGAQTATLILSSVLEADEGAYTVEITNDSDKLTSAAARLTVVDPVITSQPTNQVAELNGSATLSVGAEGTSLGYRWLKGGLPLPNATNSSLRLTNLRLDDAGAYSVVVGNQFDSVTSSVVMLTVNGVTTDRTFNPGANSSVYSLAVQADGKILVAGYFTSLAGQQRYGVGRLNADGSLDPTFNPVVSGSVSSLAVQADGKILVGGGFVIWGEQYHYNIARLNVDGTVDNGFNSGSDSSVSCLAVQGNGWILVGGQFTTLGDQPRSYLGRLYANGTVDRPFNPRADGAVSSLAVQADAKILVGGYFSTLGGQARNNLGRVNSNGTLDTTFNPVIDGLAQALVVQADGKILVGGSFTTLAGQPRNNLGRLNTDGSLDPAFTSGTDGMVYSLALQADGKILVGGYFTTLGGQPRTNIARLNADGSVDLTFNPGADSAVFSLAPQADGKILAGGNFYTLGGQARSFIGRLNNTGHATESFAYDGSTLRWQRGGVGPEVWRTTFEVTTNALSWTWLGAGVRVPDGWQLTGVSLPAFCTVRARGFVAASGNGASSWFVERPWSPGPELEVGLGGAVIGVGESGCIPLYLSSRYGLTNCDIVVELPEGRFTNPNVVATAPEVALATVQMMGSTQAIVTLSAKPGLVLRGPAQLASVCFEASSGQDSAFIELDARQVFGTRENGLAIQYAASRPGRTVVVGPSSLLECVLQPNGQPVLILYGQPGDRYAIEQLADDGSWTTVLNNLSLTDLSLAAPAPPVTGQAALFRAKRE